ncbi:hypothetical protein D3C81_1754060 [compost metagenome]
MPIHLRRDLLTQLLKQLILPALLLGFRFACSEQEAHFKAGASTLQIELCRFPNGRCHQLCTAQQLV